MAAPSPYAGRTVCLATCHGKERALAWPVRAGLGAELQVINCNTDQFGTFSGEVQRLGDALSTCRRKLELGLTASGLSLGLASEASFGPHPAVPLLPAGQELLLFGDRDRDLWVLEQRLELRTNYSHHHLGPEQDPVLWLRQVGFPRHAVIVRPASLETPLVCKGLTSVVTLRRALALCRAADPHRQVLLETDMRAHYNPTRMRSIRRLGTALVRRLRRLCPSCQAPGWGLLHTLPGLPCRWCAEPTPLTCQEVWGCQACGLRHQYPRRDGLTAADPGNCPGCNP